MILRKVGTSATAFGVRVVNTILSRVALVFPKKMFLLSTEPAKNM
jgi:hypothetical protein